MPTPLDRLEQGIRTFQSQTYPPQADRYRQSVQEPQRPHTLMITCSDSRIDIETVTSARPGELFITRNVGNLVPRYGETVSGVAAVIEYAVNALKVQHVVICGHADCGAMKALQHPEALDKLPMVRNWLNNADAAVWSWQKDQPAASAADDSKASLARLTERNVLTQLDQLKTHPAVADALARGELTVSGWVYEIGTGEVRIARDGQQTFTPVTGQA